jgi:ATP-dependent metalloprotease
VRIRAFRSLFSGGLPLNFRALQDPSSPLLKDDAAFKLYLAALVRTGQQNTVFSAARRRDSLLAEHHPETAAAAQPEGLEATTSEGSSQSQEVPKPSTSQSIAETVLAGASPGTASSAASNIPPPHPTSDASKLPGTAAATPGEPIQVSIVEREVHSVLSRDVFC